LQAVIEAIVEAAWAALPELNALGQQAITAPMFWTMGLAVAETLFSGLEQVFQLAAVSNYPALG
jgi:hypothetical protein